MTPEALARQTIDKKLRVAGYSLQEMQSFNPRAVRGVVVCEFPTKSGSVDYLIFIVGVLVGIIEAKTENQGKSFSSVAIQSTKYAESGLRFTYSPVHIRFTYEATNIIIHFCDYHDEKARTSEVFSFYTPDTLAAWLQDEHTPRMRLKHFPPSTAQAFENAKRGRFCNWNSLLLKATHALLYKWLQGQEKLIQPLQPSIAF